MFTHLQTQCQAGSRALPGAEPGLIPRTEDGGDTVHSGADSPARSSHSLAPKSPCLVMLLPLTSVASGCPFHRVLPSVRHVAAVGPK